MQLIMLIHLIMFDAFRLDTAFMICPGVFAPGFEDALVLPCVLRASQAGGPADANASCESSAVRSLMEPNLSHTLKPTSNPTRNLRPLPEST